MNTIIDKIIENEGGIDNLYFADGYNTVAGICYEYHKRFFAAHGIDNPYDIDDLPHSARYEFYYDYADKCRAYLIHSKPLQYAYLDHCFNTGIANGIKLLQKSLNLANYGSYPLSIDGAFGPLTHGALIFADVQGREVPLAEIYNGFRFADYYDKYKAKKRKDGQDYAIRCLESWFNRVIIFK